MINTDLLHSAKILIVDDEPDNVLLLEKMLRNWGYQNLTTTTDSRDAFELWKRHCPDLTFLDWMMPHVDGSEITQQIRAEAGDTFSPIVVLTADISPRTKRQALAAGARDFLNKPFDSMEVLLRMENLLEMRFLYLDLQNKNAQLEALQKDIVAIEEWAAHNAPKNIDAETVEAATTTLDE